MFVLDDLWFGNIQPNEDANPFRSQYQKALTKITKSEDRLMEVLTDEEHRKMVMELENYHADLTVWGELGAFINGFRLGGKIILDMLDAKQ